MTDQSGSTHPVANGRPFRIEIFGDGSLTDLFLIGFSSLGFFLAGIFPRWDFSSKASDRDPVIPGNQSLGSRQSKYEVRQGSGFTGISKE
jgi:hypothetical protein